MPRKCAVGILSVNGRYIAGDVWIFYRKNVNLLLAASKNTAICYLFLGGAFLETGSSNDFIVAGFF